MQIKESLAVMVLSGTLLCSGLLLADNQQPEVELTHWWGQPGEIQALDEIKKVVTDRGATFVDTRLDSWETLRSSIIKRLSMGYPPAVTQWVAYENIYRLNELDAIYSTPTTWRGESLKEILFDDVYASLTKQDQLIGLPLGIHIQNSALYNPDIYKELGLAFPKNWQEVLAQAPVIHKAGYVPLALSKEIWQLHLVLNTILLEKLGIQRYQELYGQRKSLEPIRSYLVESFEVFLKILTFRDQNASNRAWNDAALMISSKQAAMHIMGDYAKSELTARGFKAGKDFECSLTPGSGGHVTYVIDAFLMLKVDEPYLREGQAILFDSLLDPVVQANYNRKKGSIPVRRGVDVSKLDSCSQRRYRYWSDPDPKVVRFSGQSDNLRGSFFYQALKRASEDNNVTAAELVDELIRSDTETL